MTCGGAGRYTTFCAVSTPPNKLRVDGAPIFSKAIESYTASCALGDKEKSKAQKSSPDGKRSILRPHSLRTTEPSHHSQCDERTDEAVVGHDGPARPKLRPSPSPLSGAAERNLRTSDTFFAHIAPSKFISRSGPDRKSVV